MEDNDNGKDPTDFKRDLCIDQYSLDVEWVNQALLYAKWAALAVDASFEVDQAKERLDIAKAEVERDIRKNPANHGIDKITEGAVGAAIAVNERLKALTDSFLLAKKNCRMLEIGRDAFDHRKRALEKLTDLYLSNYYAKPFIKADSKELVESQAQAGSKRTLAESMQQRKKLHRAGDTE